MHNGVAKARTTLKRMQRQDESVSLENSENVEMQALRFDWTGPDTIHHKNGTRPNISIISQSQTTFVRILHSQH